MSIVSTVLIILRVETQRIVSADKSGLNERTEALLNAEWRLKVLHLGDNLWGKELRAPRLIAKMANAARWHLMKTWNFRRGSSGSSSSWNSHPSLCWSFFIFFRFTSRISRRASEPPTGSKRSRGTRWDSFRARYRSLRFPRQHQYSHIAVTAPTPALPPPAPPRVTFHTPSPLEGEGVGRTHSLPRDIKTGRSVVSLTACDKVIGRRAAGGWLPPPPPLPLPQPFKGTGDYVCRAGRG